MATKAISLIAILQDADVLLDAPVPDKETLLTTAAKHLGEKTGIASDVIEDALTGREKLGSTAIGQGIAVPHAGIDGLTSPAGVIFRLAQAIEFEASDNNPVDLVFVLVWPSDKRSGLLATLGGLCRSLRAGALLQDIRKASSRAEVLQLLEKDSAEATPGPSED